MAFLDQIKKLFVEYLHLNLNGGKNKVGWKDVEDKNIAMVARSFLKMSSVVFVVGGILEKSLRDLVVGAKASMLLDKTANGENQLTNVFDLDSVIVRDGGNLTLAPNTVLHVSSLVVGHDSSEVIPVISKIIVTTHATFKIKTSMKLSFYIAH